MTAEPVTVIVTPRDRFSTAEACLDRVFEHTPEPIEVIVSAGGMPERLRRGLESRFAARVRFLWFPEYRNTPQLRNAALRRARTRLAACIDTDVLVRAGWLGALLECQAQTGASLATPLVLDRNDLVHTAGNDLFITEKDGKRSCLMEIRYANAAVGDTTNLERKPIDFAEVHCHLLIVQEALDLHIYDEVYREGTEVDSGLVLKKAGRLQMFEPGSRVYLTYPDRLDDIEDVKLYIWKWDMREVRASFAAFERKWGMTRTGRDGDSIEFYKMLNNRIGYLTRLFSAPAVLKLDNFYYRAKRTLRQGPKAWARLKDASLGY